MRERIASTHEAGTRMRGRPMPLCRRPVLVEGGLFVMQIRSRIFECWLP
jgi:hypothetical protein